MYRGCLDMSSLLTPPRQERPELGLRIVPYYGDAKLGEDNTFFSSAVNKTIEIVVRRSGLGSCCSRAVLLLLWSCSPAALGLFSC